MLYFNGLIDLYRLKISYHTVITHVSICTRVLLSHIILDDLVFSILMV